MAWITSINNDDKVYTSVATDIAQIASQTSGGTTKRLMQKTVTSVYEWRGLEEETAKTAAQSSTHNSDSRTYSNWQPFTANFIGVKVDGTKKTAKALRSNEARGWRLEVTEVVTTTVEE